MFSLRVARGSRPTVLFRRLLVAGAAAGTGFLLLAILGYAVGHPGDSTSALVRLGWCVIPSAVTVHLAVVVARTEPNGRLRAGLVAAGLGQRGLPLLAAASTALNCVLGSAISLVVFLHLRGDISGSPFDGAAAGVLGAGHPLPFAAALTLLAAVPLIAATAAAVSLRPRQAAPVPAEAEPEEDEEASPDGSGAPSAVRAPAGLPWGAALTAIGLTIEVSGDGPTHPGSLIPLPGGLGAVAPAVLAGWALTAVGMVLSGPGLTHALGRLIAVYHPGALRLLAGRALQEEAHRVGRPLGVLCTVASAAYAVAGRYGLGPLTGFATVLVAVCATATALTATLEAKLARRHTTAALIQLGASTAFLRNAAALRAAVLLAVVVPLAWIIAKLAALPLGM